VSEDGESGVSVERSVSLETTTDELWRHLTDGQLLSEWMEGDVVIDPRPGKHITLTPETGPVVWGTVEEVIEGHRLQWSWRTDEGLPTLVEIELTPDEDRTTLTVRETLLPWQVSGPDEPQDFPMARSRPGHVLAA
jgi:uncharacterized protein YndB with AHSA1/START domain